MMQPTIGRILIYRLSDSDIKQINDGPQGNLNTHSVGQELPLIVCVVWPDEFGQGKAGVNGWLFLDGGRSLWLTSVGEGDGNGQWHWPVQV
jgi:hypothetical protein